VPSTRGVAALLSSSQAAEEEDVSADYGSVELLPPLVGRTIVLVDTEGGYATFELDDGTRVEISDGYGCLNVVVDPKP
jgi:hypothetical protein